MTDKKKQDRSHYIGAYLKEDIHKRFYEYVKNNGGSMSWFVNKALEEKLDRMESQK
jgi:hypothetical protein